MKLKPCVINLAISIVWVTDMRDSPLKKAPDHLPTDKIISTMIVSNKKLYREALAMCLAQVSFLNILTPLDFDSLGRAMKTFSPDLVLLDANDWKFIYAAQLIGESEIGPAIVLLGIPEDIGQAISARWPRFSIFVEENASIADVFEALDRFASRKPPSTCLGPGRFSYTKRETDELTRREFEVFKLIEKGLSNKEIARKLQISVGTAKNHVHSLLAKLDVPCRSRAAHLARMVSGELFLRQEKSIDDYSRHSYERESGQN